MVNPIQISIGLKASIYLHLRSVIDKSRKKLITEINKSLGYLILVTQLHIVE